MSQSSGMLASAVLLPETETRDSITTTTGAVKRRQASTSETNSHKRPRTDSEAHSPTDGDAAAPSSFEHPLESPASVSDKVKPTDQSSTTGEGADKSSHGSISSPLRRKSTLDEAEEERKRGKRLFGGLLGTLSQRSTTSTQKRRIDIDRKQQAKLQMLEEDREAEKRRKLDELMEKRRGQMGGWEEKSMRIRHDNARAMAHFLKTKAEPNLYYKPWDLLPRQKEEIDVQLVEVEKNIDNDLEGSNQSRTQQADDTSPVKAQVDGAEDGDGTQTVGPNNEAKADATATLADAENKPTIAPSDDYKPTSQLATDDGTKEAAEDNENEELVVEAGEDPVIY